MAAVGILDQTCLLFFAPYIARYLNPCLTINLQGAGRFDCLLTQGLARLLEALNRLSRNLGAELYRHLWDWDCAACTHFGVTSLRIRLDDRECIPLREFLTCTHFEFCPQLLLSLSRALVPSLRLK